MKKLLSVILSAIMLTGCLSLPVSASWANDRADRINAYYEQGFYYEALDELNWLDASGDRTVWDQAAIDDMRNKLNTAVSTLNVIYPKFALIKSYLGQGLYYEATDELNWMKASYFLAPVESQKWGEYHLDAALGIEKYQQNLKQAEAARRVQYSPSTAVSGNSYTVYITDSGSKYHRSGCRYLNKSKYAISRSSAVNQGYERCSVCKP